MKKTLELFNKANERLKQIEFSKNSIPSVSVGQFWWYFEGINIGQEISKDGNMKRPCLIIKVIPHSSLIWIMPLTTQINNKSYQFQLTKRKEHGLKKASVILFNHVKCIDKKRLIDKIHGKKASKGLLKILFSKQ